MVTTSVDGGTRRRTKTKTTPHLEPSISTMGTSTHEPTASETRGTHQIVLQPSEYSQASSRPPTRSNRAKGIRGVKSIRYTPTPSSFRKPHNFQKYDGNSNPKNWLEDYHLAMKATGATNPYFVALYGLLYLTNSARSCGLNTLTRAPSVTRSTSLITPTT